jgi:hypothetical protein
MSIVSCYLNCVTVAVLANGAASSMQPDLYDYASMIHSNVQNPYNTWLTSPVLKVLNCKDAARVVMPELSVMNSFTLKNI